MEIERRSHKPSKRILRFAELGYMPTADSHVPLRHRATVDVSRDKIILTETNHGGGYNIKSWKHYEEIRTVTTPIYSLLEKRVVRDYVCVFAHRPGWKHFEWIIPLDIREKCDPPVGETVW